MREAISAAKREMMVACASRGGDKGDLDPIKTCETTDIICLRISFLIRKKNPFLILVDITLEL